MNELQQALKGLNEAIIKLRRGIFTLCVITAFGIGLAIGIVVGILL